MANPTDTAAAQQLARLESYLLQDPDNLRLLADLADGYLRAARWSDARQVLARTLAAQPADPVARYRMAVVERVGGDAGVALDLLQGLHRDGVSDPAVLQELALVQATRGEWPAVADALAPIEVATLPAAQGDDVWLLRVRALHHTGQLDEAAAEGQAWMAARGPALPLTAAGALATLFLDCSRLDLLEQVSTAAGAAAASNAELLTANGYLHLGTGQTDLAAQQFARGVDLSPRLGRAHLGVGLAAAMRGDVAAAVAALEHTTEVMPEHLGSWHALAWMHLLKRDLVAARRVFDTALEKDHNFGDTHGGLALVTALSGERTQALEHLRVARRLDPRSMNAAIAGLVLDRRTDLSDPDLLRDGLRQILRTAAIADSPAAPMIERLAEALTRRH